MGDRISQKQDGGLDGADDFVTFYGEAHTGHFFVKRVLRHGGGVGDKTHGDVFGFETGDRFGGAGDGLVGDVNDAVEVD